MKTAPMRSVLVLVLALSAVANIPLAAAAPPTPGGDIDIEPGASFVDNGHPSFTYNFGLRAVESGSAAGLGDAVLEVTGPGISMCTIHGSGAQVDWTDFGNEGGSSPGFQCGRAYGESVSIDGCKAVIQAHGFGHSDNPLVNYFGTTTIEVTFQKKTSTSGDIEVTLYTTSGKIQLKGKATGPVTMSTCP